MNTTFTPKVPAEAVREAYRELIKEDLCHFLGIKSTGNVSNFADNLADKLLSFHNIPPKKKTQIDINAPF